MSMLARPRTLTGFWFLARAAGAAVILIGGLVLAGWAFDIETFKSVIPGMIAMNPGGTALAFLLGGVSLWIQAEPASRRLRAFGMAFAASSSCWRCSGSAAICWPGMGAQTGCYSARGSTWRACATGHPNRMAPNTAVAILLVGLALLLLDARSRRSVLVAQLLALTTALIALLA